MSPFFLVRSFFPNFSVIYYTIRIVRFFVNRDEERKTKIKLTKTLFTIKRLVIEGRTVNSVPKSHTNNKRRIYYHFEAI